MKQIIARLVETTKYHRFYELSEPIYKGRRFRSDVDIVAELQECKEKQMKPECKHLLRTDGCNVVCISDARTHIERLVFAAEKFPSGYGITPVQIDGCHTMMIHGGDSDRIYADEVYLRHLGMINRVQIILYTN